MVFATADLCDSYGEELQSCELVLRRYGQRARFHGEIHTIRCYESNGLVKQVTAQRGDRRVLVVDGGGSSRVALVGETIATQAAANGWAGIVVHGAVRDVEGLASLPIGIYALGANPRPPARTALGDLDVQVEFGSVVFRPGAWLYVDDDGLVVSDRRLTP